jgi:hypothetical protein
MKLFTGTYYTVTDEAITPTGKTESYVAPDRDEALLMALYTHRLHNGNAYGTLHGVIHCPTCGQIAITSQPEQPAPYWELEEGWGTDGNCLKCGEAGRCRCKHPARKQPAPLMVDTGEGAPQYTFFADGDQPTQLSLLWKESAAMTTGTKTFIFISRQDIVIASPSVAIWRDGHWTGTNTTLGNDKSHERALQIAQDYASQYKNPVIVDAWEKGNLTWADLTAYTDAWKAEEQPTQYERNQEWNPKTWKPELHGCLFVKLF